MKKNENVRRKVSVPVAYMTRTSPEILHLHLRNEKLNEDVNLGNIAQKTHYYSGSDLKSLFCFLMTSSLILMIRI